MSVCPKTEHHKIQISCTTSMLNPIRPVTLTSDTDSQAHILFKMTYFVSIFTIHI